VLPAAILGADSAFEIPPVPVSVTIAGQPVAITVSGDVSAPARGQGENAFGLHLRADLADFQNRLTSLLQAELNQSDRCGERIAIQNATLVPSAPAGGLTVQLHIERWACFKALGRDNARRLLGGDATLHAILTPRVESGSVVRLDADIVDIDGDGALGDLLRSDSIGNALRDKIREALLKTIQKSTDLETVIPAPVRPFVTIQAIAFADEGSGRLALRLAGRLLVPAQQISSILEQFTRRTSETRP